MKQNIKNDPFDYMILNRDEILRVIDKKPTLPKAWKSLTETLPDIESERARFASVGTEKIPVNTVWVSHLFF